MLPGVFFSVLVTRLHMESILCNLQYFLPITPWLHTPRSSQITSCGFSSLDKSTVKQEFVDTFVGGTDDIFLGSFYFIFNISGMALLLLVDWTSPFSNSTSPSMSLYQGLNRKKNCCLISFSMRTTQLNTWICLFLSKR